MANFVPVKLSYKTFESANGSDPTLSPVIFMHGSTLSKESWAEIPQIIADKTKRKVYAYDARDHGDSEYTDHFNFDVIVDDLFHFMDTMNIPKAILVGHSMGSLTATNAALRKPERVEMIFSEDMYVKKIPKEIYEFWAKYTEEWLNIVPFIPKELNETEAVKFVLDTMFRKVPQETVKDNFGSTENLYKMKFVFRRKPDGRFDVRHNKDALLKMLKDHDHHMSDPSGQFKGPVVFMYGSVSNLKVGTEADHIRKHFPNAEFIEFAGASHNIHDEYPEKFVETILAYLKKENFVPVKLSYTTFESAKGSDAKLTPVIFMHGSSVSKESWVEIPQIIADKTKRKAYAYDARNHGDSEYTDHYDFDANVDDLFHFMDSMNIPKAILVGHSMGSLTATNAALRKPKRVEMVFSEDMYVKKIPKEFIEFWAKYNEEWINIVPTIPKELNETEAIKFFLDTMSSKFPQEYLKDNVGDTKSLYSMQFILKRKPDGRYDVRYNKDAFTRMLKNPDRIMSDPIGQFKGPAVFMHGSLSQFQVGTERDQIRKHFPNAELIEFVGATHHLHYEFPEKFVETIVAYLQKSK